MVHSLKGSKHVLDIRNFGAKSIDEVKAKLVGMGLKYSPSEISSDTVAEGSVVRTSPDAGQTVQANCPNGLLFGTVCQPGMAVIVISANVGAMGVLFLFFPMVLRGMGPVAAALSAVTHKVEHK